MDFNDSTILILSSLKYMTTSTNAVNRKLIIVCAGALAFIVLYNLTNINITERIREIVTWEASVTSAAASCKSISFLTRKKAWPNSGFFDTLSS